jgi:FKBP-type peptidyl-prolyl cis-trans isomerase
MFSIPTFYYITASFQLSFQKKKFYRQHFGIIELFTYIYPIYLGALLSALARMLVRFFFSSEIGHPVLNLVRNMNYRYSTLVPVTIKNQMKIFLFYSSSCLGKGEVIKGWDLGVATMKRGERAIFFIRQPRALVDFD